MKYITLTLSLIAACTLSFNAFSQDATPKDKSWPAPPNPLETGICKDGNCQCGNDFCPKGAHCLNDHCYCTYTDPKSEYFPGRPREYYLIVTGMGQFTCGYDLNNSYSDGGIPTLYCENSNGCLTKAGAFFPQNSFFYHRLFPVYSLLNTKSKDDNLQLGYYLIGNPDALDASMTNFGDCVFEQQPAADTPKIKVTSGACNGAGVFDKSCGDGENNIKTVEVIDTKLCQGGKHYCHGNGNLPAPKPDGDGYICKWADSNTLIRTWVCTQEGGCTCGGKKCAKDHACINHTCMAQNKIKSDRKNKYQYFTLGYQGLQKALLDLCGRESAEKLKTNLAEVTAGDNYEVPNSCDAWQIKSSEYGCVSERRKEPDRCQWRQACDPWNIPRANRDQYICEFEEDLNVPANKMGCYYYPKAVGIKCIDPKGCVCKNSTIKTGEYCSVK